MNPELRAHEIPGIAAFEEGPGGLVVLVITSPRAEARIFPHGAQLTHWKPAGSAPVIFTSAESLYQEGKAIRGGVPVCFPWFGPREGLPAHGFVRNRVWAVEAISATPDGTVRATFVTASDDATRAKWPHDFVARFTYTVGETLTMDFDVENPGPGGFAYSEALHTYFTVGDAAQCTVEGLDGVEYRDFLDRTVKVRQTGPIHFAGEVDRVYVDTASTCILRDPVMDRRITVEKEGSLSTTVWNPWIEKSASLADFGDDEWKRMVCIETVNAWENSITLAPGEKHRTTARISVAAGAMA